MAIDIHDARESRQLPVSITPPPASDNVARRLHPAIYLAILGLAIVFVAAAGTFAAPNDSYYLIEIACGFILVAVGLPYQLLRVRRHGHDPRDTSLSHRTLGGWLNAEFDVWQTRIRGWDAAAAILLPVAAVSIGLVCLTIVMHLDIG
ncbi:MAG TPA: hypothetical protein VHX19_03605 [Stellaceae bacterium]|jgi:hypothetical protein|nr:hypothetical protein [Stellaceae bacterium]